MNIEQFVKERDDALLSLDKGKIEKYMRKYHVRFEPSCEIVFWAAVHKAIIELNSATEEQKMNSAKWLIQHKFYPGIREEV